MNPIDISISSLSDDQLRGLLTAVSLEWERRFAVAPPITSAVAEFDAARLAGTSLSVGQGRRESDTAVTKGFDFRKGSLRYQVKSNRPSGKPGSPVTLVGKAKSFDWDKLIWILYDHEYHIEEAWEFDCSKYRELFEPKNRLSPDDMRRGTRLNPKAI